MAIVFVDTNIVIDYIKNRDNEELVAYVDSFDTVYINDECHMLWTNTQP